MTDNNYNLNTDFFQEFGIEVCKIEHSHIGNDRVILIQAKPIVNTDSIVSCPYCGSVSIKRNGFYTRTIKHIKMFNFKTIIKLNQCRFLCRDCKKSFNQECKLAGKYSHMSNDLKLNILSECRKKKSFSDIGLELNVCPSTVLDTFNDNVYVERKSLTKIICIDEFAADTNAGKYALSIGDPCGGEILDVLKSRKQDFVYYYFKSLSVEERSNVKYIITDLCEAYRTIVRNLFFNSVHIADRFHWIKLSTNAFNLVRIRIMKDYIETCKKTRDIDLKRELSMLAYLMKSNYKAFLANRYNKEAVYYSEETKHSINGKQLTRQDVIEIVLNSSSELENSYYLLQDLYKISIFSSYETFDNDISNWMDNVKEYNIKEFKKVLLTYKEWKKEIRNSFIIDEVTGKRLTNGFIEGKNNICKVIKRNAFGFKDFSTLRNKILYSNTKKLLIKNTK